MTYEITLFNNMEFGNVRALTIDNEPWFVGSDVASDTEETTKADNTDESEKIQQSHILHLQGCPAQRRHAVRLRLHAAAVPG